MGESGVANGDLHIRFILIIAHDPVNMYGSTLANIPQQGYNLMMLCVGHCAPGAR